MALLEFSVTPLGAGSSVGEYVARCVAIVDASGLDYEVHSMGTIVEGDLAAVLDVVRRCIEATATDSDRVTCSAKIDLRRDRQGQLSGKLASLQQRVGHPLRRLGGQPA